jgi:hypothetical protein
MDGTLVPVFHKGNPGSYTCRVAFKRKRKKVKKVSKKKKGVKKRCQ